MLSSFVPVVVIATGIDFTEQLQVPDFLDVSVLSMCFQKFLKLPAFCSNGVVLASGQAFDAYVFFVFAGGYGCTHRAYSLNSKRRRLKSLIFWMSS